MRSKRGGEAADGNVGLVIGAVLVLFGLFIIGPILLFALGAVWSAALGWMLSDDAERRAAEPNTAGA